MKKIRINFVDFWANFNYEKFYAYKILKKHYDVEISENPDYIFYSGSGYKHLDYNCIKIFFTGENIRPDFNFCDYAIGFDYITFEDRYIRYPLYLMLDNYLENFDLGVNKHLNENNKKIRKKFCNMVVSSNDDNNRVNFFNELSKYKKVDSGGRLLNNVGGPVEDKLKFQKNYKFSLSFENSSTNGYTTEKIIDAFASGGIPIYYGDPLINKVFNEKSFINANAFKNNEDLIEFIKKIDQDDNLYLKYINEPMLLNKKYFEEESKKLEKFILNIFEQDLDKAKRVSDSGYTKKLKKEYLILRKIIKFKNNTLTILIKIKKAIKKR